MKNRYLPLLLVCSPFFAHATDVSGRFDLGGYAATEHFSSTIGGETNNDDQTLSLRTYLRLDNIDDQNWMAALDLRDKNDFFGKNDAQDLQLTNANAFQIQELDTKYSTANWSATIGRFHAPEAGVPGVDGAEFQLKHSKDWSTEIFGGWNPKTEDQIYYQFNANDYVAGVANTYQTLGGNWNRNFFTSNGLVAEQEDAQMSRTYLFDNSIWQWQQRCRLITLLYLDFVPRTYVQNGNVTWQEGLNERWSTQVQLMGVDLIGYTNQAGVLERFAPSPYKDASFRLDYNSTPMTRWEWGISDGERDADGLTRQETYLGFEQNQIFSHHGDITLKAGYRANFESDDEFGHIAGLYYANDWEYALNIDYADQRYVDGSGEHLHPLTVELDVSYFMSKNLYGMFSLQRAADEIATIYSGFIKVGYRFGDRNMQALRSTAPPKGQL